MPHLTDQIAALEAELAQLKALQKAEDDEKARAAAARPAGIPLNWLPAIFESNGTFTTVAWYDPGYTISILKLVSSAQPFVPLGGKP